VRVLLVNPYTPYLWAPRMMPMLGILHIASALRTWAGVEPEFWDCNYHKGDPPACDILMVTANSGTYAEAERLARRIPARLTVVGGPHPTSMPEQCLTSKSPFGVAVMGEGEETAAAIVNRWRVHQSRYDLADIGGLALRLPDGRVKRNPLRPLLDINRIPWPAYDLWPELGDVSVVDSKGHPAGPGCSFFTSRGCPFDCNFCDLEMWRRTVRFREVKDCLAEIDYLRERFGITHLRIQDDTCNLRKDRWAELCQGFKERGLTWRAHTRTDHVSLEEFKMIADCGCVEIGLGIESGSQKMLDLMNKRNTVENHANAIAWAKEAGLHPRAYIIIGFPGETWETCRETVAFLKETRPHQVTFSTFVPYPGCAVWRSPEKFGVTIRSQDWDKYWLIGLEETEEGFIAEYPEMPREELVKARRWMLNEFEKEFGSRDRRSEMECACSE